MGVRRNAGWQERLDERILELLNDEPWSILSMMEVELPISATETQIRERCLLLADANLIVVDFSDGWRVELTTEGKLYLEGTLDMNHHPVPRRPNVLEEYAGS